MSCDQNIKAVLVAWQQNQPIVVDICKYKAEQVNKIKKKSQGDFTINQCLNLSY